MDLQPLLIIHGDEQARVDPHLPDAGLPPAVGVSSYCVFRAAKDVPEMTDGRGWTYHHHVDMACWRGKLYVGWNSCERDEDVWPARELYSSSDDGANWSAPTEMFPQGLSTCLRVYFFLAPNGVMLMIAGLRAGTEKTSEDTKSALIVRELKADHTLGEVHTLQPPTGSIKHPPLFDESGNKAFVQACRALLADTAYLEQQDRGRLLGRRRMKWHDAAAWPGGKVPGDSDKWVAGKAFSFFKRPDGALVGVSKMGWTTISFDEGKSWQQPAVPPTLVTGKAKVWSQQTADGRFALVYNPSTRHRFPLAVVTGDDGVNFRDMRIVQGELPIQRYAGADRSIGPQYVRGVSSWSDDGSRRGENAMWLVYSMSKEDIWVSRVALPVAADETLPRRDDLRDLNFYCPKWASIQEKDGWLKLESHDPFDCAAVTRVFREAAAATISFDLRVERIDTRAIEIDVMSKFGSLRPIRIRFEPAGRIVATSGADKLQIGTHAANQVLQFRIDADGGEFTVTLGGTVVLRDARYADPAGSLQRITFRTGEYRGVGGKKPVPPGSDRPCEATAYSLRRLIVQSRD